MQHGFPSDLARRAFLHTHTTWMQLYCGHANKRAVTAQDRTDQMLLVDAMVVRVPVGVLASATVAALQPRLLRTIFLVVCIRLPPQWQCRSQRAAHEGARRQSTTSFDKATSP